MPKDRSSTLFELIKSLSRSEKRYFRLSEQANGDSKYLKLFDLIDKQKVFNDVALLEQESSFKPSQFSNLKAHLYSKILQSLRDFSLPTITSIQIRELIDEAQILFNKSLYQQSSNRLEKARKLAIETDNNELQLEILKWKKQVLIHEEGTENSTYGERIIRQVTSANQRINNINLFSNLHTRLQALYRKNGYIRNQLDFERIEQIFNDNLPIVEEEDLSISERIHLFHLYITYYFFIQDFDKGYAYAEKWVELFREQKALVKPKLELYINGLNYLLIAQNKLGKYHEFQETKRELRTLNKLPRHYYNENIRLKLLKYTFVHEFNSLFLGGDFDRGVELIERLSSGLQGFIQQLDKHSRVIFFYKTACLYFGASQFKKTIYWLNEMLNTTQSDLREDIHGFARIVMLISHYELNNIELIQYYVRSTYRFLLKKEDMHQFQKLILGFLRGLHPGLAEEVMIQRFELLFEKMLMLQQDTFESRAFVYFDIVSWLESKIQKRSIQEIIKEKSEKGRSLLMDVD